MIQFILAFLILSAEIIQDIVVAITPFVVMGATATITYLRKRIPDWVIVTLIVPLLSAGWTLLSGLLAQPELIWWQQFIFGLLAVYLHQLYKKLNNTEEKFE
jgi:uncharacterized membrane protein YfcA